MRISLNDIRSIENYLEGTLTPEESLVFQAKLLSDPVLKWNVYVQQKVYSILHLYHRKKLKEEAETIHQRLFGDPMRVDFQQAVYQLFKH